MLFLDEPTSGLDPVATREVRELIDGLRDRGVTVFLTTHRLEEAERLLITKALARFEGNANRAAEALGLSRSALYRRLQKYGLS